MYTMARKKSSSQVKSFGSVTLDLGRWEKVKQQTLVSTVIFHTRIKLFEILSVLIHMFVLVIINDQRREIFFTDYYGNCDCLALPVSKAVTEVSSIQSPSITP